MRRIYSVRGTRRRRCDFIGRDPRRVKAWMILRILDDVLGDFAVAADELNFEWIQDSMRSFVRDNFDSEVLKDYDAFIDALAEVLAVSDYRGRSWVDAQNDVSSLSGHFEAVERGVSLSRYERDEARKLVYRLIRHYGKDEAPDWVYEAEWVQKRKL